MKLFIEEYGMTVVSCLGAMVVLSLIKYLLYGVGFEIIKYNIFHLIGSGL
ncbi:hypothetical protein [Tannockella kyphosi]|nr:hypothetical protein [Tannockella kyphosi]